MLFRNFERTTHKGDVGPREGGYGNGKGRNREIDWSGHPCGTRRPSWTKAREYWEKRPLPLIAVIALTIGSPFLGLFLEYWVLWSASQSASPLLPMASLPLFGSARSLNQTDDKIE